MQLQTEVLRWLVWASQSKDYVDHVVHLYSINHEEESTLDIVYTVESCQSKARDMLVLT